MLVRRVSGSPDVSLTRSTVQVLLLARVVGQFMSVSPVTSSWSARFHWRGAAKSGFRLWMSMTGRVQSRGDTTTLISIVLLANGSNADMVAVKVFEVGYLWDTEKGLTSGPVTGTEVTLAQDNGSP